MIYKNLSIEEPVHAKVKAAKAKYDAKCMKECGVTGSNTEFMDLVISYWDSGQAIQEAVEGDCQSCRRDERLIDGFCKNKCPNKGAGK